MFKMLIADDERYVREGFLSLCDWKRMGIDPVLQASSGNEALQTVTDESPDIFVSDIRMPGINGLDLVKKVREINPYIKCFFLTGYAEFDYVYNAIQQGVVNFFLKPLDRDAIQKALENTVAVLDIEIGNRSRMSDYLLRECFENTELNGKMRSLLESSPALSQPDLQFLLLTPVVYPLTPRILQMLEGRLRTMLPRRVLSCVTNGKVLALIQRTSNDELAKNLEALRETFLRQGHLNFHADVSRPATLDALCGEYGASAKDAPLIRVLSSRDGTVQRVIAFVEENLSCEDLNLAMISRQVVFLSTDYIGKLFKKETGMYFSDYLVHRRIANAKELLSLEPNLHCQEVAERVGYGKTPSYFSTLFRKITGVPPTEYIKQVKIP
jgi:two-component system, response regulator YesN